MASNTSGSPQVAVSPLASFYNSTQAKTVPLVASQGYTDGGTQIFNLPQAGLGNIIYGLININVTIAGTVTGGTFAKFPAPAPFSAIKRIKLYNSNSYNLFDLSGFGLYTWQKYRTGIDYISAASQSIWGLNPSTTAALFGSNPAVQGQEPGAGTYNICVPIALQLAYNEGGDQGLLVLQQNSTQYILEVDYGQLTGGISATGGSNDLFSGLTGTGLSVTATANVQFDLDYFDWVANAQTLYSMYMSVQEITGINPLTAGQNTWKLPVGDFYSMVIMTTSNNGALLPVADFSNINFQYGGNTYKSTQQYGPNLSRNLYQHLGCVQNDGTILFDFGLRRGMLTRRDKFANFNNQLVTNAQINFNVPSGLTVVNGSTSVITERLSYQSSAG